MTVELFPNGVNFLCTQEMIIIEEIINNVIYIYKKENTFFTGSSQVVIFVENCTKY